MAKGTPLSFGELRGLLPDATAVSLKSALIKGRERGEYSFDGNVYSQAKKKPQPIKARASVVKVEPTKP